VIPYGRRIGWPSSSSGPKDPLRKSRTDQEDIHTRTMAQNGVAKGRNKPTHIDIPPPGAIHLDSRASPEFGGRLSPLHMPPGQIDGLESLQEDAFLNGRGQSRRGSTSSSLHIEIPSVPSHAEIAMSAMQYLPYPLLILNNLKTLVMANDAMGRLLGTDDSSEDTTSEDENPISLTERLRGQTLSQLGIDLIQEGRPVWVHWDSFMDSIADDARADTEDNFPPKSEYGEGDVTPTAERTETSSRRPIDHRSKQMVHDAVVEVVIATAEIPAACFASGLAKSLAEVGKNVFAKMIITVWEVEEERFFTLTFTNTDSSQSPPISRGQSRPVSRVTRPTKHRSLGSSSSAGSRSSPSSISSGHSSNQGGSNNSSALTSPLNATMSGSPFPPLGPPSRSATRMTSAHSSLQKIIIMKEALLDGTKVPTLAMWHDESITIPNKAARKLFHPTADLSNVKDGFDLVSKWALWDETFTEQLHPSEYPISVLVRHKHHFQAARWE